MATVPSTSMNSCPAIAAVDLPDASMHCEQTCRAVLRGGTSSRDPWFGVLYRGGQVQIALRSGGDVLCSGVWRLELRRDGRLAEPVSPWKEVFWASNEGVDYVELSAQFSGGIQVERQILLARDGFLLLADVVLAPRRVKLDYRALLPLAPGIRFDGAAESYEGIVTARRRRRAKILPLALPEWRADPRPGSLAQTERGLELCQTSLGRALWAPLFVDLVPRRFRWPLTWRPLTVAESLANQPPDVAAGFRVRIGRQQWLMYRSLAAKANRTLLGHNLSGEMLVARFGRDGEVTAMLEIE